MFKHGGPQRLIGYNENSHNTDQDDGKSMTGHLFFYDTTPITWCSQKQETMALSSCEAESKTAMEAAKQAIWLQKLLSEITGRKCVKTTLYVDNKSVISLTKNPVFHRQSKHIHKRYHFIREYVEKEHIDFKHIAGSEQGADILTKALARIKFKEMRELIRVQDLINGRNLSERMLEISFNITKKEVMKKKKLSLSVIRITKAIRITKKSITCIIRVERVLVLVTLLFLVTL